jgi:hypothetical protein
VESWHAATSSSAAITSTGLARPLNAIGYLGWLGMPDDGGARSSAEEARRTFYSRKPLVSHPRVEIPP